MASPMSNQFTKTAGIRRQHHLASILI
uniref:Transposase n=1 Tax=Panagrellus redivivus TaxID=6233 RepID=A0A7E4UUL5_PANRE